MKKPYIPSPTTLPDDISRVLQPMKQIVDHLTGTRSGELSPLATTATLTDVIAKVNEIVARLNFTGE